jgi:hypothetical protein
MTKMAKMMFVLKRRSIPNSPPLTPPLASSDPHRYAQKPKAKGSSLTNKMKLGRKSKETKKNDEINPDTIEFTKKALHVAWHPRENLIAVGAANNLYLYAAGDIK